MSFVEAKDVTDTDVVLSLLNLFVTLSRYELREFRQWIDQVEFRYDLLRNLPLEITQQVLGYLPLYQCFRIRRVSKAWLHILSEPATLGQLLRFWYSEAEANFLIPKGLTSPTVLSAAAENVDAYRSGKAYSMMKWAWGSTDSGFNTTSVAYSNGYIAWVDGIHHLHRLHLE